MQVTLVIVVSHCDWFQGWGQLKKELELVNSILELERESEFKVLEQNELNWN